MQTRLSRLSVPALILLTGLSACDRPPTPVNGAADGGDERNGGLAVQPDVDNATEIVEAPATGVALGWGWNRGDSEPIPTICVEFVPGEEPAQSRYMTMQEVNDSYELMQSLGMSAEASVKTIGFEASGKAQFAKSQNVTSARSTFVLNAVVENGVRYAAPVPEGGAKESGFQPLVGPRGGSRGAIRLTPDALRLARKDDPAEFQRHCGSDFVSAIYGGAKLTGVISFASTSKTDKQTLSATMSGSGWGARFESKVKGSTTSYSSSERMDVSIFMTGGQGDAIPANQDDLIAKLQTISLDAYTAPKDFNIAITPYEVLSNWPGRRVPDRQGEFEELASYWGAYNTLYDEFQRVLDNPEQYMAPSPQDKLMCDPSMCQDKRRQLDQAVVSYRKVLSGTDLSTDDGKAIKTATDIMQEQQEAMQQCVNSKIGTSLAQNPVDLAVVRRAQDEVLVSLKRMEGEARECVDKSDTCLFDASTYRSPYAFRIQLPVPLDAGVSSLQDLLVYRLGQIAKNRCALSSNNPGCLSNAQIGAWGRKVGLESVNKAVRPALFAQQMAVKRTHAQEASTPEGADACLAPRFELEPGHPGVLWFNPRAAVTLPATRIQPQKAS